MFRYKGGYGEGGWEREEEKEEEESGEEEGRFVFIIKMICSKCFFRRFFVLKRLVVLMINAF
ncbi:unnamed protein product [Arabidopsis halleri]